MPDVLVNYRSADAPFGAAATYELLSARWGKEQLFLDNQSIAPGTSYVTELLRALESIKVLLVLIGPAWLADDPASPGTLLIERRDDWVGREIRRSLERGIHIVPVLMDGTAMPDPAFLPADLRPFVLRQAVEIRHQHLGEGVSRLADHLSRLVPGLAPDIARPHAQPQQLPASLTQFVGRATEMARLHMTMHADNEGAARITVISGAPGIGKTTLATCWAHQVKDKFPDGQLHIDLRGFDQRTAVDPAEALHGFLLALGVPPEAVPNTLDARAALYRTTLADRRVLVVLDNAHSAGHVRPLLPGSPSCPVLITSRTRLHSLAVREGAEHILLGLLSRREAHSLLAARLQGERLAAEPHMATKLIEWCAGLPLALSTVGALVDQRPGPLNQLVHELGNERNRLDVLESEEEDLDVRTVFSWSYRRMSPPARRLFRLLGVHPGPDISRDTCTALCEDTNPRRVLDELIRSNLVIERGIGRLGLHDLLRAYAAEQARVDAPAAEQASTFQEIADHYLWMASAAARRLNHDHPLEGDRTFTGYLDALNWFIAEYAVIAAVVEAAPGHGLDSHVWRIAPECNTFLRRTGRRRQRVEIHRAAVAAATRSGDELARANASTHLASALARIGEHSEAGMYLAAALPVLETAGDRLGQMRAHLAYTRVLEAQHRYDEAARHTRMVLSLAEADDDTEGQADALAYLGIQLTNLGRYSDALPACTAALRLYDRLGHHEGRANCLLTMGMIHQSSGEHRMAITCYEQSSALDRQLGDHYWEAICLEHIGTVHDVLGHRDSAHRYWADAHALLDKLAHPDAARLRNRTGTRAVVPAVD